MFDHDERDINCLTAEFSNLLESNKIIYACKEGREWRRGGHEKQDVVFVTLQCLVMV